MPDSAKREPSSQRPETRDRSRVLWWAAGAAGAACLALVALATLRHRLPGVGTLANSTKLLLAVCGAALAIVATQRGRTAARRGWASTSSLSPGQCLLLGAWFGLMLGFLEVGHRAAMLAFAESYILRWRPVEVVWITPATYLLLFGAVGGLLAMLARLPSQPAKLPLVVFALALIGSASQTLFHSWLDQIAALVLCSGIAVVAARAVSSHAAGFWRLVRTSTGWAAVAVGASAVGLALWPESASVATAAGAGARLSHSRPNVLLVVLDTVRADHLGFDGYDRNTTPNLDRLAATGVVFENAISTSPWTLPAHVTLLTGRFPHESTADFLTPMGVGHRTLAEIFARDGYATAGFVGNLSYCTRGTGIARGFAEYQDYQATPATIAYFSKITEWLWPTTINSFEVLRNDAGTVTDLFLDWLPDHRERPFFALLNYFDAHSFYITDPAFQDRFGDVGEHLRHAGRAHWDEKRLAEWVNAYDACVAYVDHEFRRVLDRLERDGLLENTLIAVVGDHGEQFGEHGLLVHANSLYLPLLHVPLVLSFGGHLPGGTRISAYASTRDVAATILDLSGLGAPPGGPPGRSLRRFWVPGDASMAGGATPLLATVTKGINRPAHEPVAKGPMSSLIAGGFHYIRNGDGREELYDLVRDPEEEHDLTGNPRGSAMAATMRLQVDEFRGR